jgi:protein polybromo-1
MKKIAKNIDTAVEDFCKQLATRFDLDVMEVSSLWKMSQSASATKKSKGATKKSGYVMFGLEVRPLIGAEHPDWDFVAKSKEIGRRWTALPVEEKNRYKEMGIATATTAVAPEIDEEEEVDLEATQMDNVDEEPSIAPASIKKKKTAQPATLAAMPAPASTAVIATAPVIQDEYALMSLKDLKNVCKTKGVKISGKREELLDRIRNAPVVTGNTVAPIVAMTIATVTADEEEDIGAGTPGSVGILPEGLEEEEEDVAPAPVAPKKKHKQDAFPAMASSSSSSSVALATPATKKLSGWNKLSTKDLQSQCDDWDIDFEEDTPREELIRALDNYIH